MLLLLDILYNNWHTHIILFDTVTTYERNMEDCGKGGVVVVGVFQLTYLIDWYWTTSVYYARENKFIMIDHIHSGRIDFFYPIFFYVLLPNLYSFIRSRIDKGFKHHRFITFTAHIIFSLIISNGVTVFGVKSDDTIFCYCVGSIYSMLVGSLHTHTYRLSWFRWDRLSLHSFIFCRLE